MRGVYKQIIVSLLLIASASVVAEKSILFQDKTITIFTDNTVLYADGSVPVFKPSSTWVEEDYFTQQEKYCEVDSKYTDKIKNGLKTQ